MTNEELKKMAEEYCRIAMKADQCVIDGRVVICEGESASRELIGEFDEETFEIRIWPENLQKGAELYADGRRDQEKMYDYLLKDVCFHESRHMWQRINRMAYHAKMKYDPYYSVYREKVKAAKPFPENPTALDIMSFPWELDATAYTLLLLKTVFNENLLCQPSIMGRCRALMQEMWPYYRKNILKIKETLK